MQRFKALSSDSRLSVLVTQHSVNGQQRRSGRRIVSSLKAAVSVSRWARITCHTALVVLYNLQNIGVTRVPKGHTPHGCTHLAISASMFSTSLATLQACRPVLQQGWRYNHSGGRSSSRCSRRDHNSTSQDCWQRHSSRHECLALPKRP